MLTLMKRVGVVLIALFAFFGLANSLYLAQSEASGAPLLCNIQNFLGCNTVTESEYARLFGVPLAEYGVVFYGILFALAALEIVLYHRLVRRVLQIGALFGLIASLYFTFVQMFLIDAFCIYCLASALVALLIFISASFIEPIRRRALSPLPPPSAAGAPVNQKSPTHLTMPPSS